MRRVLVALVAVSVLSWTGNLFAAHSDYGCINCHAPHRNGADPLPDGSYGVPLWNNDQLGGGSNNNLPTFQLYSSPTFDKLGITISQPDGPSRLCLGCHDGSYSHITDPDKIFRPEDLAHSHPISFVYDQALAQNPNTHLKDPTAPDDLLGGDTIANVLLDSKGKVQCTSCHDVHTSGLGMDMLRLGTLNSDGSVSERDLCRACHNK